MNRFFPYAVGLVLLGGLALTVVQCGGAVCGNNAVEGNEQCDKGSMNGQAGSGCSTECKLVGIPMASLQVAWNRLKIDVASFPSYPTPTCLDLGIDKVHVVLAGPTPKDEMIDCQTKSQQLYSAIQPGTYQATVTFLDKNGAALTKDVKSAQADVQISPSPVNLILDFTTDDYLKQDYTGRLYLEPSWGTMGTFCAAAVPAVVAMGVKLTPRGSTTPVPGMTNTLHKLDGTFSPPDSCVTPMPSAQPPVTLYADALPWGYYDVVLTGIAGGLTAYCQKFDVFVAPSASNANAPFKLTVGPAPVDGGACP
jgi:cysteine-rich repeat protein